MLAGATGITACGGDPAVPSTSNVPPSICDETAPSPEKMVTVPGLVSSLAVGGGKLFVMSEKKGLLAVPGCGGDPEVVDATGTGVVAVAGDTLYSIALADDFTPTLKARPVTGGGITAFTGGDSGLTAENPVGRGDQRSRSRGATRPWTRCRPSSSPSTRSPAP